MNPSILRCRSVYTASAAADSVDVVIIGAGVIGLAVARALATRQRPFRQHPPYPVDHDETTALEILVLDRAATIGSATSSRNSEVIHAGIYYPPSSLKAKTCVRGRQLLYEYCDRHHIPYRRCGKLVVATTTQSSTSTSTTAAAKATYQLDTLRLLHEQAKRNGVDDVKILNSHDTRAREPILFENTTAANILLGALWSPSTGVIDSHLFMQQMQAEAEETGHCTVVLHTSVDDATTVEDVTIAVTSKRHAQQRRLQILAGGTWLSCRWIINCAGLWATSVANLFHSRHSVSPTWQPPRQYFARGSYMRLVAAAAAPTIEPNAVSHLIYPVPDPNGGLGVHLTTDCYQSTIKFGPDVEWVPVDVNDDPDAIDLWVDPNRVAAFYESIRTYWPDLPDGSLVPDYMGVRPKLFHPMLMNSSRKGGLPFQDFMIAGPETHGVPGLIHLFGIESPGLTSSLAIADHIAKTITAETS